MEPTTETESPMPTGLTTELLDEVLAHLVTVRLDYRMDSSEANDAVRERMFQLIISAREEAREGSLTVEDLVAWTTETLNKLAVDFPEAAVRRDVTTSCYLSLCASGLTRFEDLLMAARRMGG